MEIIKNNYCYNYKINSPFQKQNINHFPTFMHSCTENKEIVNKKLVFPERSDKDLAAIQLYW